ncbi:MAG TPA: hypothetical protein VK813_06590, partial [Edaphobacter sp.]|nr:hypothetical protein [Edaphobacter sp.]
MKRPSTVGTASLLLSAMLATISFAQSVPATSQNTAKTAATAQPWKKIPVPPLHAFKPVQPKRIELANGLVIFLQEDHELPFIN